MTTERTTQSLADLVGTDIGVQKALIAERDRQWLEEAQVKWDEAEKIASRFNLVEDLNAVTEKIKGLYTDAKLIKSERPAGEKRDTWKIDIQWEDDNYLLTVGIEGGRVSVYARTNESFDAGDLTKERLDAALFEAYKNPLNTREYL